MRTILPAVLLLALPACGSGAGSDEPPPVYAAPVADAPVIDTFNDTRTLGEAPVSASCDGYDLVCEPDTPPPPPVIKPAKPEDLQPVSRAADSQSCDPHYAPCVPIASDVDCAGGSGNGPAYVAGPVQVIGRDVYKLDRDGDGIACDR